MITTTTWVRRGAAAQFPTKYEIDEAEMDRISKLARMELEGAKEDLEAAQDGEKGKEHGVDNDSDSDMGNGDGGVTISSEADAKNNDKSSAKDDDDDDLKEYNLDHYDSDEVDEDGEKITMFGNVKSLAYHKPHEEDPYLVVPDDEEENEEREELQILPSDNLLLAGKVEDEVALLEVYVYEDEADNLYVHHDIMLPAIPLCLEWLDTPVGDASGAAEGASRNFVAVGTMEPDIEIWDLDVVDSMYPNAILGQGGNGVDDEKSAAKKKKSKKRSKPNNDYHVDSVLALAANRSHRNLLASGSADTTVKLWDLNSSKCAKSYSQHTDKVCSLDWHPTESTVLLSGSYDRTVVAADMRAPDNTPRWGVDSDVENVQWDPHDGNYFYVTTDSGLVYRYDVRQIPTNAQDSKPVWLLQAHDSSVSAFDANSSIPGYVVTGSTDKQVKLWDVYDDKPRMVVSRKLDVGKVFSTNFAPDTDVGFRLAVAGSKGVVQVWDTSTNASVRRAFVGRMPTLQGDVQERTVGVNVEDDDDDDESDEEEGGGEMDGQGDDGDGGHDGWESMDED